MPDLDDRLRRRLARRFGDVANAWLDELPPVLNQLAERWGLEFGDLIQRGSFSVVIRCRTRAGRAAVLKASPDRERIFGEARALRCWSTPHVPSVLALDENAGTLLIEAIEPGTALDELEAHPGIDRVAGLVRPLHDCGRPFPSCPPLSQRVAGLFDSWARHRHLDRDVANLVSEELYERGRRFAARLAVQRGPEVLLHGDLTPVNVLDGGPERGLVAVDPAACVGDPAFDAVDLVLWLADDVATIADRAEQLAPMIGVDAGRLLDWCMAFAGMATVDVFESPLATDARLRAVLELAERTPVA